MKKFTLILSLILVATISFSGCSKQEESNDNKTLTIGFGEALENYNPSNGYETRGSMIGISYETLFIYDDGEVKPNLVETYEWSDNHTELTLHLKENIIFHDGEEFNAQAVVKNLEWMKSNPMYGWIAGLSSIKNVKDIDMYTVSVTYSTPYYAALQDLSLPVHTAIVSPNMLDINNLGVMNGTSGTGPYIYTGYENNIASFKKNDNYWGNQPQFEQINVQYIPDANVRQMALKNGEIDIIFSSSWISYDNYVEAMKEKNITGKTSGQTIKTRYLSINAQNTILNDVNMRKALASGIDNETIAKGLLQNLEKPSTSILSQELPYCDIHVETTFKKDNENALLILKNEGWTDKNADGILEKDGVNLQLNLIYPQELALNKEIAEVLKAQLGEIGIDITLIPKEYMLWGKAFMDGEYDLSLVATNGLPYDPQNTINPMLQGSFGEFGSIKALNNGNIFFQLGQQINTSYHKEFIQENYEKILNFLMTNYIDIPLTAQKEMIIFNTQKVTDYNFGGTANLFYPENINTKK